MVVHPPHFVPAAIAVGQHDTVNADDHTFERDGVTMVVDEVSLDLLAGSEVDYVEELEGRRFGAVVVDGVRLIDNVPLSGED